MRAATTPRHANLDVLTLTEGSERDIPSVVEHEKEVQEGHERNSGGFLLSVGERA